MDERVRSRYFSNAKMAALEKVDNGEALTAAEVTAITGMTDRQAILWLWVCGAVMVALSGAAIAIAFYE